MPFYVEYKRSADDDWHKLGTLHDETPEYLLEFLRWFHSAHTYRLNGIEYPSLTR